MACQVLIQIDCTWDITILGVTKQELNQRLDTRTSK